MKRVIHKLSLKPCTRETYHIADTNAAPKLLSVAMQGMIPTIWYERDAIELFDVNAPVDPKSTMDRVTVEVLCVFTGEEFEIPEGFVYAGNAASHDFTKGPLVVHVYVKGFDVSHNNQ